MCRDWLQSLSIGKAPSALLFKRQRAMLEVLLNRFGARVDVHDSEHECTCVHMLIFDALQSGVGRQSKSGGRADMSKLTRYRIEPLLELLLQASKKFGCIGDMLDIKQGVTDGDEDQKNKLSLLDLPDESQRTPLDFALAHRRVDLVAMLLAHGAEVNQKAWKHLQWDAQPATHSKQSKLKLHPDNTRAGLAAVYSSVQREDERRWGLVEGLEVTRLAYTGRPCSISN